jgi:hypothetical protein
MDLRDVATGKLHQGRPPVGGRVGLDQHASPGTLSLGQGRVQVGRLVAGLLSPVRVWEMAIHHEDGDVAERRRDADPPDKVLYVSYPRSPSWVRLARVGDFWG